MVLWDLLGDRFGRSIRVFLPVEQFVVIVRFQHHLEILLFRFDQVGGLNRFALPYPLLQLLFFGCVFILGDAQDFLHFPKGIVFGIEVGGFAVGKVCFARLKFGVGFSVGVVFSRAFRGVHILFELVIKFVVVLDFVGFLVFGVNKVSFPFRRQFLAVVVFGIDIDGFASVLGEGIVFVFE